MNCPNCQTKMNEIATRSKYGAKIFIDQCPNCGGLWFDDLEMYLVKKDVANLIDKIDRDKLTNNTAIKKEIFCPRDNTPLKIFSDINFPDSIKVESCQKCSGFFFNRGEFFDFVDNRHKKIESYDKNKEDELTRNIDKLLKYDSAATYDTLGKIGGFLSQNYYHPALAGSGIKPNNASKIVSVISGVIYILLRLFLKR